jgi:hypothetical protein
MPRSYVRRSQTKINIAAFYHLSMSSLSQALDRDPSQSVRAEKKREFAAVVEIVLNDVPDHPLASQAACLSRTSRMLDNVIQGSLRKAGERVRHHLPGGVQPCDQLGSTSGRGAGAIPQVHWLNCRLTFTQNSMDHANARTNEMSGVFAYRTELRCGTQGQVIE